MRLKVLLKSILSISALSLVLVLNQNCSQAYHAEGSGDFSSVSSSSDALFVAAKQVIASNCASCHQSTVRIMYGSAQEYIGAGLIQPGQPDKSLLITRLKNFAGSSLSDMPRGGSLPDSDYQILRRWILDLGAANSGPFLCEGEKRLADVRVAKPEFMSERQWHNTLSDILRRILPAQGDSLFLTHVQNIQFPAVDVRYVRNSSDMNAGVLKIIFDASGTLAEEVAKTHAPTFIQNAIGLKPGTCAVVDPMNLSVECQKQLVRNLGELFYRRPLSEGAGNNEVANLQQEFQIALDSQNGLNNLLFRFLMAPDFLFRVENHGSEMSSPSNMLKLSSYEVASRLSYKYWNTMPDKTLYQMASAKNLGVDANFAEALTYVLNSPRISDSAREFAYGYFVLSKTPHFNPATESFRFYNDANVTFDENMTVAMNDEVQTMMSYLVQNSGGLEDLFDTDISFTRYKPLMDVYGISAAAPVNMTPGNVVRFPANTRSGVLTRGALLANGSGEQHIIHRAIRIKRDLMCMNQEPPPADTTPLVPLTPQQYQTFTVRERVAHNTGGGSCISCHQSINPWGYGLTFYNGLGYFKKTELALTVTGQTTGAVLDLDARSDTRGLISEGALVTGGLELSHLVSGAGATQTCFAKNYATYFYGHNVSADADGCFLNKMVSMIRNKGPLKEIMGVGAYEKDFRYKKID